MNFLIIKIIPVQFASTYWGIRPSGHMTLVLVYVYSPQYYNSLLDPMVSSAVTKKYYVKTNIGVGGYTGWVPMTS